MQRKHDEQEVLDVIFESVELVRAERSSKNAISDMFESAVTQPITVLPIYKDHGRVRDLARKRIRIWNAKGLSSESQVD